MLAFPLLFVHTGRPPTQCAFRSPGEGRHALTSNSTLSVTLSLKLYHYLTCPSTVYAVYRKTLWFCHTISVVNLPLPSSRRRPETHRSPHSPKAPCRGLDVAPLSLPVASPPRDTREGPDDGRPGLPSLRVPVIFSSKLYHHSEPQSTIFGQIYTGSFFQRVTIHPSSRLAHIRSGEYCSPYMPVASNARRYGGSSQG